MWKVEVDACNHLMKMNISARAKLVTINDKQKWLSENPIFKEMFWAHKYNTW